MQNRNYMTYITTLMIKSHLLFKKFFNVNLEKTQYTILSYYYVLHVSVYCAKNHITYTTSTEIFLIHYIEFYDVYDQNADLYAIICAVYYNKLGICSTTYSNRRSLKLMTTTVLMHFYISQFCITFIMCYNENKLIYSFRGIKSYK